MNSYPDDFVVHNLPLVLLSGLQSDTAQDNTIRDKSQAYLGDGGFRIRAELPPLHHPLTQDLRNILLSFDSSNAPWHSPSPNKTEQNHTFKIQSVGRVGQVPTLRYHWVMLTWVDICAPSSKSTSAAAFPSLAPSRRDISITSDSAFYAVPSVTELSSVSRWYHHSSMGNEAPVPSAIRDCILLQPHI